MILLKKWAEISLIILIATLLLLAMLLESIEIRKRDNEVLKNNNEYLHKKIDSLELVRAICYEIILQKLNYKCDEKNSDNRKH